MNKITKNQTQDLMEAYSSIYESNELTEEQIIENFNLWVDQLIGEGYDLSEYTEDELYECYVNESWASVGKGLLGALQSAGKAAWHGTTKYTRDGTKFVPGAKHTTKEIIAKGGKVAPWVGLAAGADQILTGGRGREWTGAGLQKLGQLGRMIPRPGQNSSGAAKPAPPQKEKPKTLKIVGGQVVGFNETYDDASPMLEATTSDFALLNNKPGYIVRGPQGTQFRPINTASFDKKELDRLTADYVRRRGSEQVSRDIQSANKAKADQMSGRRQPASQPSGATRPAPSTPATAPVAAARPATGTPASTAPAAAPTAPARPTSGAPTAAAPSGTTASSSLRKDITLKKTGMTAMDQWRAANPRLAAAADEKARIRGTAQTDNPLMKDIRGRLPLTPSVQSPTFQKTMAGSSGNQSLVSNPNAAIAASPRSGSAATPIRPTVIPQNRPASSTQTIKSQAPMQRASTTQSTVRPQISASQTSLSKAQPTPIKTAAQKSVLRQSYEYDAYDIILEYLIDRGHVDTLDEANYLMLEMDETAIHSILEEYKNYFLSVEISEWVDGLLDEGYDLSEYTWDDLVEYYINEAKVDSGKSVEQKEKDREGRGGGPIQHFLSRGVKTKGRKRNDNKYLNMQRTKKAANKDKENSEYNERQRVQTRGTWDKD